MRAFGYLLFAITQRITRWLQLVWTVYRRWLDHDAPLLAAAIAFYAMLSLSPLLVVAVAVTALVVEREAASRTLTHVIGQAVNEETARFAQEVLRNTQRPSSTLTAAGLSLLLMLLGATRLFRQLKAAVNMVWGTRTPSKGFRDTLREHLLAVLMLLLAATMLILWLGVDVALSALSARWQAVSAGWRWLNFGAGWALLTLLFALAYRLLPEAQVDWRDVWRGAAVGALLFALCKLLVGVYLGMTGVHSVYGAASAAVVLLLWAYFSTQAFLFGAEWTRVIWEERRKSP